MEASTPAQDPVQKSNKIVGIVVGSILLVLALGLVVYFVTRESEEDKALQAVCKSRADIQTLFPGYTNSNGAIGYFPIDTTTLSNGVHTIFWIVTDDQNRAEGIGSRYFIVEN